ncbi:MAG TPA: EAL domain-containing protein [Paracoccaceae bacterium]|nr:EAL domain-containing protein [Paracoccaceae bacterium]
MRRRLIRHSALALGLIALLVMGADWLTRAVSRETDQVLRTVYLSTRQTMLSQRVAALVQELASTEERWRRERIHADARAALDLMLRTHAELSRAGGSGEASSEAPHVVLMGPSGLDAKTRNFAELAQRALARPDRSVDSALDDELLHQATSRLLPIQERAARQAELDARAARRRMRQTERALFGAILLLILAEWLALFRPQAARMARQSGELGRRLAQLRHGALHDPLTGLPNRRYLGEFLQEHWPGAAQDGRSIAVAHVDLDRFKAVNDLEGHGAGDAVLRRVAEILRAETRASDLVARVGGDEFVIVLPDLRREADLTVMAERIIGRLAEPIPVGMGRAEIGASIGIAISEPGRNTPEGLLTDADFALNTSKRAGRGRLVHFTAAMREAKLARDRLRDDLRHAVEEGRIIALYQPQIDLRTDALAGFEALLRWDHPEFGMLPPGRFIEIAEDAGLIDHIGQCVIAQALDALAGWTRAGLEVPRVSLNLSSKEIRDPRFIDWLKWQVDQRDLAPERVTLELVETVLVERDDDCVIRNVQALAEHGFGIDLDDFGTGLASMANLLRLKVDRIKIDPRFVQGLRGDPTLARLASTMVAMAHNLGLEVLAEGVEDPAEAEAMRALGCDFAQGYAIARPMDWEAASRWLARGRPGPRVRAALR